MADNRIKDLTGTVVSGDLSALLNTLYLAVDDTSFTDAKKVLLKSLLSEAVVDANTNNYQAMTPKAFYDSIMTTTRRGIGMLAADADVTTKTGTGLLNSVHQALMQAQWKKDFFMSNGNTPMSYVSDTGDLVTAKVVCWQSVYVGTPGPSVVVPLSPAELTSLNRDIVSIYVSIICSLNSESGGHTFNQACSDGVAKDHVIDHFGFVTVFSRLDRVQHRWGIWINSVNELRVAVTANAILD